MQDLRSFTVTETSVPYSTGLATEKERRKRAGIGRSSMPKFLIQRKPEHCRIYVWFYLKGLRKRTRFSELSLTFYKYSLFNKISCSATPHVISIVYTCSAPLNKRRTTLPWLFEGCNAVFKLTFIAISFLFSSPHYTQLGKNSTFLGAFRYLVIGEIPADICRRSLFRFTNTGLPMDDLKSWVRCPVI